MYARKNVSGNPIVAYHGYPIAEDTAIERGQVVKLSGGLIVPVSESDTDAPAGVAAESHTGAEDALNERSNGKDIYVYDAKDTLFACPAPTVTAASGTETTLTATEGSLAAFGADDLTGGCVQLIAKAEDSANTDAIGQTRKIAGFGNGTLTLERGGAAAEGDVYRLFPPIGFAKGNYDATRTKLTLSATAALGMAVAGHEIAAGNILLKRK